MTHDSFKDIEKLESDLWEAADNLRANSKLTSSDYFMPVLGVIFLRHAANRFDAAHRQIEADQASGKMPKRKVLPADYIARRSLYLPEKARYDWIMQQAAVSGADLPKLVTDAMTAIEAEFEPLLGVLPKDYGIFETKVLEDLMRLFNSEQIKQATGDVFGRIYEYFLAKFSIQKAHDNGEFFTPSSIVQTIVNVIEPDHGTVFDPACGSGGMFVQSSHFIEHEGGDTAKKVVFYGQEKNRDTIRIAKMNLAVHGLEGKIAEAITYYQDEHSLAGKCDFVMANPPFNVDLVDAERIKGDPRLPFGLPGVNKQKKVGNGNYLWISYFWSYLVREGPRRLRHVLAGLERRARREGGAPQDRRDGRRGRDDLHPLQLLLHPHRPLRAVALRPGQAARAPGQGADARRAQRLPQGHAQDLRLLARADAQPRGDRLALSRPAEALPRAGEGLPRPRLRRERRRAGGRSPPSRPRSPICAGASMRSPRPRRSTPTSTLTRSRRSPMPSPNCARRPRSTRPTRRSSSQASAPSVRNTPRRCPTRTTPSTPRARRSTPSPRRSAASSSRWTCSTSSPRAWPTSAPSWRLTMRSPPPTTAARRVGW